MLVSVKLTLTITQPSLKLNSTVDHRDEQLWKDHGRDCIATTETASDLVYQIY